jgi:hypothetical protein
MLEISCSIELQIDVSASRRLKMLSKRMRNKVLDKYDYGSVW